MASKCSSDLGFRYYLPLSFTLSLFDRYQLHSCGFLVIDSMGLDGLVSYNHLFIFVLRFSLTFLHSTIASEGFNCNVSSLWYILWKFYQPCILHYLIVGSLRYSAGLGDSELRYSRCTFDNEDAYFFIICIDLTWFSWFDIIILTLVWCRYDQHVQQARPTWAARRASGRGSFFSPTSLISASSGILQEYLFRNCVDATSIKTEEARRSVRI